jgi:NitT/TauT family transport system substrate-binding protein
MTTATFSGRTARLLLGIACCASALLFAAPQTALGDDALSVVAGNPTPGLFDTLELIADGAGFYRQQHLIVTKNYSQGPSAAAQLVATGKADVVSISVEPVLIGYEKGLRLQFFLSRQARYSYVLGVLAGSPIRSLADFKGTVLGESTAGSPAEVAADSMLAGAGLKPSDFSYIPVGIGAGALSAMTSHRVDGGAFSYFEFANDEAVGQTAFRIFRHPILKDIGNVGYAATPETIRTKADQLRRFSRAIVEAALFVRLNPAAAARLYLQGTGQRVTDDALRNTTRLLALLKDDFPAADPANKRIGLLPPRNLDLYGSYLAQYGMIHAPVPGDAITTTQFIGYANDFDHKALEKQIMSMH